MWSWLWLGARNKPLKPTSFPWTCLWFLIDHSHRSLNISINIIYIHINVSVCVCMHSSNTVISSCPDHFGIVQVKPLLQLGPFYNAEKEKQLNIKWPCFDITSPEVFSKYFKIAFNSTFTKCLYILAHICFRKSTLLKNIYHH